MEEKKKKKKEGRRAYLNDFKMTLSGEYIYTGATYLPEGEYQKTRAQLLAVSILTTALAVFCGCIPAEPMLNTFYVIIPFAVTLVCAARLLWAAVRLCINKLPLREYVLKQTFDVFRPFSTAMAIFSAVTVVATLIFGFVKGFSALSLWTWAFMASHLFVIFLGVFLTKITKKLKWVKQ